MEDRFKKVKNPLRKLTGPEREFCRKHCNFTPEEESVFDLRVRDWSVEHIAMELPMSKRTISRRISDIMEKVFLLI